MGVSRQVMACAVLLGLLTQVPASSPSSTRTQELQESSPSLQQLISLFDYLQNRELEALASDGTQNDSGGNNGLLESNSNKNRLRELANAYDELLRQNMLQQSAAQHLSAEKRASYMSLCHFKICNMGRKRTPYEAVHKK
ncbi:CNMamide [Rhodnius prolixus]|uniref:CNMamide n=1 Tax=Rhodnius prolixus TaxID=13249 RepID=UPI003D18D5B9